MESLGEFKSRQQSTSVVELQFPSEEPAAVTLREEDGLKKISDKAASFFPPSPLCLDDPSSLACSVVVRPPSIHPSIPISHLARIRLPGEEATAPLLFSAPPRRACQTSKSAKNCQTRQERKSVEKGMGRSIPSL